VPPRRDNRKPTPSSTGACSGQQQSTEACREAGSRNRQPAVRTGPCTQSAAQEQAPSDVQAKPRGDGGGRQEAWRRRQHSNPTGNRVDRRSVPDGKQGRPGEERAQPAGLRCRQPGLQDHDGGGPGLACRLGISAAARPTSMATMEAASSREGGAREFPEFVL
jgi:hypothetical protein